MKLATHVHVVLTFKTDYYISEPYVYCTSVSLLDSASAKESVRGLELRDSLLAIETLLLRLVGTLHDYVYC